MARKYSIAEKEAYKAEQTQIRAAHERFDAFMSQQGWTKSHLFMRGSKWVNGSDTIIYDTKGWQLNGVIMTEHDLHKILHYV